MIKAVSYILYSSERFNLYPLLNVELQGKFIVYVRYFQPLLYFFIKYYQLFHTFVSFIKFLNLSYKRTQLWFETFIQASKPIVIPNDDPLLIYLHFTAFLNVGKKS